MFIVGYNMVGYLPESDPYAFDEWEDAKRAMIGELERSADCATDEDQAEELSALAEDLNLDNGPEWWAGVGNMSYWIMWDEGSADEYNNGGEE